MLFSVRIDPLSILSHGNEPISFRAESSQKQFEIPFESPHGNDGEWMENHVLRFNDAYKHKPPFTLPSTTFTLNDLIQQS